MKRIQFLLAEAVVELLYWVLCLMRWLFLSSRIGVKIHNFLLARFTLDVLRVGIRGYATLLMEASHGNQAAVQWERKMYMLNPVTRRRMMKNVFVWAGIVGRKRWKAWTRKGFVIPQLVFISPTYRCNLSCIGCYAASPRPGDLPFSVLDRVIGELQQLGVFSVLFLGGEPFVRKDIWLLFEKYRRTIFNVYTNGTFLGQEEITKLAHLGNVRLLISMEGFRENTDARRGEGIYDTVVRCLEICQQENIIYGVSVTVTKNNFQEVVSNTFIEWLVGLGAFHVSYIPFMPMGKEGQDLVLETKQVVALDEFRQSVTKEYPIHASIGRSGSDLVTACDAANRILHITANGDVEPCMFVPWAIDNIKEKSILEVIQSDFFQLVRGFNSTGETKLNPCKWYHSRFLELAFQQVAHPTRQQKGGLIWQSSNQGEVGKNEHESLRNKQPVG